jgi:hypothetical protein
MGFQRLFAFAMAVAFCVAAWPALAAQAPCPPYNRAIVLDFIVLQPKPVYNNRLSIQGIRNLFATRTQAALGPHQRALGITYAETTYGAEANSRAQDARGGYCVYLTSLDIKFGWKRMEVYVASEFEPGTCEYRSVLDHENQHVAINNGALREFAPRFRGEVEKMLRAQQPVFARNAQAGMDQALASLDRGMSGMLSQFQRMMAERNAPIDSADNYAATGKLCENWKKPPG